MNATGQMTFDFSAPVTINTTSAGQQLRDMAISKGTEHADALAPGWNERAYKYLVQFLHMVGNTIFMAEDVRNYAEKDGFEAPASNRAWGGCFVRAKREGLIQAAGIKQVRNPKAHCANATMWQVKMN